MFCPLNNEQRTAHLNDNIEYPKQVIDNPQLWEAPETAANTGQFQNILCAAHGLEALSNLSASQLGSSNPNLNPFSSVQVDSATEQVAFIRNEIANIRSEVDANNGNQNNEFLTVTSSKIIIFGNEGTSHLLFCKELDSSLLTTITDHRRMPNKQWDKHYTKQKRKERGWNTKSPKLKKPTFGNAVIIPARDPTLDYKEAKRFKTAFSQPTARSPYYRDYAPHLKTKPYKGEQVNAYSITFDNQVVSFEKTRQQWEPI